MIDPKPMAGDPHYEVAPLLWNRWDEMVATGDAPRCHPASASSRVVDTAGLDEDRARDWVVVRMVHNAMWCIEDNPDGLDAEEQRLPDDVRDAWPRPSRTERAATADSWPMRELWP